MLRLLHKCSRPGYPADFLVSRIHGKIQGQMAGKIDSATGGSLFQADDRSFWNAGAGERLWIFQQMEEALRATVAPVLFYFELNTLIIGLRSLGTEDVKGMDGIASGILAEPLHRIFQTVVSPGEALLEVERFMAGTILSLPGLARAYEEGGVGKCEEIFRNMFLEQVLSFCSHPGIQHFFRLMIDLRNTMTMAKALRWEKKGVQSFLDGGNSRLSRSDRIPSEAVVARMVWRLTGKARLAGDELHPVRLEPLLYAGLARTMGRQLRSFDPVQCCVGYIWHCFMTSRKKSQEYHFGRFVENFPETGVSEQ